MNKKVLLSIFVFIILILSYQVILDIKNQKLRLQETVPLINETRGYSSKYLFERINYTPSSIIPFWFWNGNLTKEELSKQIELIHSIGIKEVIIHARSGLVQEYLSEEWFEMVEHVLKELNKREMKAWIYDEFDWPSAIANGKVLEQKPYLIAKNLKMIKVKENIFQLEQDKYGTKKIISVIFSNIDKNYNWVGEYCKELQCVFTDVKNNSIYVFYQDYGHFETEYKKNHYVDLLDKETTLTFINLTHDEYYKRFSEYFGSTIIGFFTDEPGFYTNTYNTWDMGSIPWSDIFEEEFYRIKGYNISDFVFYIWHDDEKNISETVKIDYFEVRTDLYVNNYFKTLHDWTKNHNVLLTGHVLIEENLYDIINFEGDFLRTMEYLDILGTDDIMYFDKDKITPHLVSSAEFIYSKPYSLTETFGGYGWDLTYEEVKEVTDWLFDNGVDIIVPHAFFYTTEGELQYKDYPPSFFYQNEILWPNMKEYVGYVNEKNKTKNTSTYAIVVYPIKKAWSLFDPSNSSEIDKLDKELKNNVRKLIKEDIMFILVPDYLLEK